MSVWEDVVGQEQVVATFQAAAAAARLRALEREDAGTAREAQTRPGGGAQGGVDASAMTHAWLVTGPPGSGRSNAARAFAAALQCTGPQPGCGQCKACRDVMSGSHPDVVRLATGPSSSSPWRRSKSSSVRPSVGPGPGGWRVILVEDADRMVERTTNVLLKSIEEPPPPDGVDPVHPLG